MRDFLRVVVVAFVSTWLCACDSGTKPKPDGASPVASEAVFAPTDLDGLRSKLNRRVVVEGKITGTGQSTTGSVRYLNFTANHRDSVALVFLAGSDRKGFPEEKLKEFVGKKVRIAGLLSDWKGALQIRVFDVGHIRVLPE